jgi:hypothetical protein
MHKCGRCGTAFLHKKNLTRHLSKPSLYCTLMTMEMDPLSCPGKCGSAFLTVNSCRMHTAQCDAAIMEGGRLGDDRGSGNQQPNTIPAARSTDAGKERQILDAKANLLRKKIKADQRILADLSSEIANQQLQSETGQRETPTIQEELSNPERDPSWNSETTALTVAQQRSTFRFRDSESTPVELLADLPDDGCRYVMQRHWASIRHYTRGLRKRNCRLDAIFNFRMIGESRGNLRRAMWRIFDTQRSAFKITVSCALLLQDPTAPYDPAIDKSHKALATGHYRYFHSSWGELCI